METFSFKLEDLKPEEINTTSLERFNKCIEEAKKIVERHKQVEQVRTAYYAQHYVHQEIITPENKIVLNWKEKEK